MKQQYFPGYFSVDAAADSRRGEFDCKNEVILRRGTPVDCVFFGDSITERWELNAYFSFPNGCVLNRGIGGDRTEYAAKRFYADVVQLRPKRCVSLIGINDAWDLEDDPWKQQKGSTVEQVLERAVKNHEEMLRMAAEERIALYLCSVLPCDMPFTGADEYRRRYISLLNQELRCLCKKWGSIYVDYYSSMVRPGDNRVRGELMIEGLHPNAAGYDCMAKILQTTISEVAAK